MTTLHIRGTLTAASLVLLAAGGSQAGSGSLFEGSDSATDHRDLPTLQERSFGSLVPCAVPLRWRVAGVDPRFEIDESTARAAVREAAALWERVTRRPLFIEDPDGGFPIRFDFDDRQASLRLRQRLRSELEERDRGLDLRRGELAEIGERLDAIRGEHEERRRAVQESTRELNREVQRWNDRGGAPEPVRAELRRRQDALEIERRSLNRQAEELRSVEQWRRLATEGLNQDIEDRNRRAQELLRRFPARIEESGRYHESVRSRNGEIVSVEREIRVFRFADRDELVLVLAHELGHALGLGHSDVPGAVMSEVSEVNGGGSDGVHESDVAMLRARCPGV